MPAKWSKILIQAHWFLLGIAFTLLTLKGFLEFKTHYDYLAYHLPFALSYYDLTSFTTYTDLLEWFKGYPPLAHRFQGLLVRLSGRLSFSTGANSILFFAVLAWIKYLIPALSLRWFLTLILATPLAVIHLPSGYIDIWVASACLLMFAGIVSAEEAGLNLKNGSTVIFGAALGVLSKYQAWSFIGLIGLLFLARQAFILFKANRKKEVLLLATGLALAVGTFPIINTVKYHSPMYPIQFAFLEKIIPKNPALRDTAEQMPDRLRSSSKPEHMMLSMFEVSRFQFPDFHYSIDQGAAWGSPHFRMGGWGFYSVTLLVIATILIFAKIKQSRIPILYLMAFLCLLAFMPANHELRYWLMVPFCFAFLASRHLSTLNTRTNHIIKAAILACAAATTFQILPSYTFQNTEPRDKAPLDAIKFWQEKAHQKQTFEVRNKVEQAIFWSGPTFREVNVKAMN